MPNPWVAGDDLTAVDLNKACGGYEKGEWTISANLALGTPTLINNWIPFTGATIAGISHSAGVFTVGVGGTYAISFGWRSSAATADRYAFIVGTGTTDVWNKNSVSSAASGLNCAVSVEKQIAAGGTIRCYAYSGAAANAIHETASDLVTGVTIYRLGW